MQFTTRKCLKDVRYSHDEGTPYIFLNTSNINILSTQPREHQLKLGQNTEHKSQIDISMTNDRLMLKTIAVLLKEKTMNKQLAFFRSINCLLSKYSRQDT